MRNITISISDEVARWARIWAAEHDTSVSAMVSLILKESMEKENDYRNAMDLFFSRTPTIISDGVEYPKRDSLYDR